ncbi:MAG: alkaline phosphatase PhoX [Sedimenticolaceae bacterium]
MYRKSRLAVAVATTLCLASPAMAGEVGRTDYPDPMMRGDTPATDNGWSATPIYTFGETADTRGVRGGYLPPGIPDGMAAFPLRGKPERGALLLVNHELAAGSGYPYTLANGTVIPGGARVSFFQLDSNADRPRIKNSGPAYDTIYDRAGNEVVAASQLEFGSFNRFCSARGVAAGEFGMRDDVFLTGEETSGGTQWILDVAKKEIWAAPAMGRGAWESWTPVASSDPNKVAFLGGDDRGGAPLYLYVGVKDAIGDGGFLDRNGFAQGNLYCWRANDPEVKDPTGFNGFFATQPGVFVKVDNYDPNKAGLPGWDALGYADQETLDEMTTGEQGLGCFQFSRPEDLHNDPFYPNRVVMASTGRSSLFPVDSWGTVYIIDTNVENLIADIKILHDADALEVPDEGIRSPDNLTWADDGTIYVQEDRSVDGFGSVSGIEASMWKLDPVTGAYTRIGEMCRGTSSESCSSVAPDGSKDGNPDDLGNWESSGVIDVTGLFRTEDEETLLLFNVQAHSILDGIIADENLVQGGQLIFLRGEKDD